MSMVEISRQKLKQIFAKTSARMAPDVWQQSLDDFLKEVEAKSGDPIADIAYRFPAFLRLQKMTSSTVQSAHFEWILYSRAHLDFGHARHEKGFLSIEPSVELFLLHEASSELQLPAGMYAIFKTGDEVEVTLLRPEHVKMLEALQEGDRKYRARQLVEVMAEETSTSSAQWQMTLSDLINWGIIQDNS
jgi:hypothetical protein